MKIQTIQAVNAYRMLKELKLSDTKEAIMISIWKNMKTLRPYSESYDKDSKECEETLNDSEHEDMRKRAQSMTEKKRKADKGIYSLTIEDMEEVDSLNEYFKTYSEKGRSYFQEMEKKEIDVELDTIPAKDMLHILQGSGRSFGDMEYLNIMID